jgi:phosphopantothenoylcysteine decarboxylase/phosphopantothenate--cysteine ligase
MNTPERRPRPEAGHRHPFRIKAAAVADYRPKQVYDEKMKKQPGDWNVEMERTKDILQSLGESKKNQFVVGFAAETTNHIENGREKLQRKHLDAIIINNIATEGAGFGGDTNIVTYMNKQLQSVELALAPKRQIAESILKLIHRDLEDEIIEDS